MTFFYDPPSDTIRTVGAGVLIATMGASAEPDDAMKMAVAGDLYDALVGIISASILGKLPLPADLFEAGHTALMRATPPRTDGPR